MNKMNKISRGLCFGLGIVSILSVVPAYASESNYVSSTNGENATQYDSSNALSGDSVITEYVAPIDGDIDRLNIGWTSDGGIRYYCKDESRVKVTGWQNINNKWYYFDASDCSMQTGWLNDNGTWYYLTESRYLSEGYVSIKNGLGAMKTGWLNDNGTWYYLNANGSMAANTTINGYTLGSTGAWIQ